MTNAASNMPDRPPLAPKASSREGPALPEGPFPDARDIPDMRRDAIEEAAETSPEAYARFARLNRLEAEADPALTRMEDMKG
jgi:hypothetical protein